MAKIPESIINRLNELAQIYAQYLFDKAYNLLKENKYRNTGQLLNSLKVTWLKADENYPPRILLIYLEYADIFEQKKLSWVRTPPPEELIKWVMEKGLHKSGKIPGYTANSRIGISDYQKAQRIGWAISIDKRINDTHQRKPWKRQTLSELLKQMNYEVHEAFRQESEQLMANALQGGIIK